MAWQDDPIVSPPDQAWQNDPVVSSPNAVAATGEGDGFLAKINAFLRKPSPEWLQAPEQVARETITGMMPHDIPSYLESLYPPAAMAHRAVDVGEQLAQGDVSGVPFVGRVPEIIAAEDTPAGSVERYRTARNTLMDLGLLAGGGETEPVAAAIKRTSPEATLAEKITQPRVEPPAPQEPLAPVTPETPPAPETGLGFKTAFSNVEATADLYQQAFDALQQGKNTIAGVRDPILARHKAAFDRGEIQSPEDLKIAEEGKGVGGITPEAQQRATVVQPTAPEPYTPEAAAARAAEPTPPLTVEPPTPSEPVGGNVAGFEKVYGPGEIPAGETLLPEEAFAKAQARLASGAAKPYSFVARAKTGAITPTEMGDLVAEHDRLINEAAAREGTPEYDGAYQAAKDFATNVLKPAQTAWHQKGMVMQIKAPIDYSRLTGFRQAMEERIGREMMPSEAPHYQEVANDVAKAEGAARESQVKSVERVQKHYARTPDVAFEDAVQSMHKQIEELTRPCIL